MPGLGNDLVVNLAGNNTKLKSAIAESKGGLKGFASSATGFLNPVVAGFAAVAGGAVAAGVAVYGFSSRLSALAEIDDKAVQTGLGGKFIQQIGYAADMSGVSVDTLIGGIKKLTIAIGKGDEKPFEALGLSLAKLKTLSPEAQFLKITETISKLPTAADRAAAAVRIFGKSGIEMTGLFAGGMDNLNALMRDAENLGIGISDEGLAKAARADDAIQRMKASFGALLDQVTVGLAPAFEYVGTTIADMIPPVTKLFEKFNALEAKAQFIGDVLAAGVDVGIEQIRLNWSNMLDGMIEDTFAFSKKILPTLMDMSDPFFVFNNAPVDALKANDQGGGLAAAQQNLDNVLARLNDAKPFVPQGPQAPIKIADDGSRLKGLFGGIADAAGPIVDGLKSKVGQAIGAAKIDGNFWSDLGKKAIGVGGDKIKPMKDAKPEDAPVKIETQFAGAMQRGSAEAYSTIVAAMKGNKDPQVKAIDKSTKAIVAAVKGNKPPAMKVVAGFA
jgi:hypothetical protein